MVGEFLDDEVVIYNHNRTPKEHRAFNLHQRLRDRQLLNSSVNGHLTGLEGLTHEPSFIVQFGTNITKASLEFTILDKLEHWVLRDDRYDTDDELPSLVNTEQESLAGNPPSPEPLDILSLLTRIWDNASALYDITNHHPTLTPISEQAHIQVLIEQVQQVVNTLHNLQRLISPPLPPIPVSHDPEERHGSSYFAARIREQAENLRNVLLRMNTQRTDCAQHIHQYDPENRCDISFNREGHNKRNCNNHLCPNQYNGQSSPNVTAGNAPQKRQEALIRTTWALSRTTEATPLSEDNPTPQDDEETVTPLCGLLQEHPDEPDSDTDTATEPIDATMSATQQEQARTQSFSFRSMNEPNIPDVPPRSSFPSFQLGNVYTPQDSISSLRQATGAQPGQTTRYASSGVLTAQPVIPPTTAAPPSRLPSPTSLPYDGPPLEQNTRWLTWRQEVKTRVSRQQGIQLYTGNEQWALENNSVAMGTECKGCRTIADVGTKRAIVRVRTKGNHSE
ncbi:hypothetical protein BD309DRAFT_1052681 [Dichomitus squalens]|nr:hypothetical protein BD309DRAFT_1052681 [Dichomitus squalens]